MDLKKLFPVVVLFLLNGYGSDAYKILGIFHTHSKSHYIAGGALMKGLAEKGHDVTVISPFPQSKPLKNFRDVSVLGIDKLIDRKSLTWIPVDWKGNQKF